MNARILGIDLENLGFQDQERLSDLRLSESLREQFADKIADFIQNTRRFDDDDWESAFTLGAELSNYLDDATKKRINASLDDVISSGDTRIKIIALQAGIGSFNPKSDAKPVVSVPPQKEVNRKYIETVNDGRFVEVADAVEDFFSSHFSYAENTGFDRYAFSALAQLGQAILSNHDTTTPLGGFFVNKFARRALGMNPTNTMAWSHAARALWAVGFLQQAEIYYWEGIRRNPDNSYFYGELSDLIFEKFPFRRDESLQLLLRAKMFVGDVPHIENRIVKHLVVSRDEDRRDEGLKRLLDLVRRDYDNPAHIALLDALICGNFPFENYVVSVFDPLSSNPEAILHLGKMHIENSEVFAEEYMRFVVDHFAQQTEFKALLLKFLDVWSGEISRGISSCVLDLISPTDTWAIPYFEQLLDKFQLRAPGFEAQSYSEFHASLERFQGYPEWAQLFDRRLGSDRDTEGQSALGKRRVPPNAEVGKEPLETKAPDQSPGDASFGGSTEEQASRPTSEQRRQIAGTKMDAESNHQDDLQIVLPEEFSLLHEGTEKGLQEALQLDAEMIEFLSHIPREIEYFGRLVRAEFWLRMGEAHRNRAIDELRECMESEYNLCHNFLKVTCERHNLFAELNVEENDWEPSAFSVAMQRALSRNDISILKHLEGRVSGQEGLVRVFMAALGDRDALQEVHDILLERESESSDTVILLRRTLGLRPQEEPPVWSDDKVVQLISGERARCAMESVIDVLAGPYLIAA